MAGATLQPIIWGPSTNHGITPNDSTYGPSGLIQTIRTSYTWQQADTDAGFAAVPVTFPVAFADSNYTLVWGVNHSNTVTPDLNYFVGDFHSKTAQGATLVARSYSPSYGTPGDILILQVIAIHD
jgi:hypothetical protein